MYLLYLDESGGVDEVEQEYYVLGGISTHEKKPYYICNDLDAIQNDFFPDSTESIEFHASHIRNGKGEPWQSMTRVDRLKVLNRVYDYLAHTPPPVSFFAVAMHKASFPGVDPIQKTCEEVAGHFDAFLGRLAAENESREKNLGLMIFDQNDHEKTLRPVMAQYRSTGATWGRVKNLAEIPMFTDSRLTRMLQIADFVAYAVFRRYQHGDANLLDRIIPKFDQSGGKLHGLVHLVSNRQDCYCPSCVTRRPGFSSR